MATTARRSTERRRVPARKSRRRVKRVPATALRTVLSNDPPVPAIERAVLHGTADRVFIAAVSLEGPWELRSLVVNDFEVLGTTVPTSSRRIDVPISPVLGQRLRISWSMLAGHAIPRAGVFLQAAGAEPVRLATTGPLKKGQSWAGGASTSLPPAE